VHVFVVPSWYPGRVDTLSGVFVAEQVQAIAELRPEWTLTVATWGQGELQVPLRVPRRLPLFGRAVRQSWRATRREVRPNLVEYRSPVVTWSPRIRGGNWRRVLRSVERAYDRAVAEFGPVDLVHAHVCIPGGLAARELQRRHGMPYLVTEHMGPFPLPGLALPDGTLRPLVREALEGAAARIAVSTALAGQMASYGLEEARVIPNLVDERLFVPAAGPQDGPRALLAIARSEPVKGIDQLVRALALVPPSALEGVELRIALADGRSPALDALAAEVGLAGRITWIGALSRTEVVAELQRCTFLVVPSRHESFGVVAAEAMACGKPVVATRSGGPEDVVTPETGLLVAADDAPALAAGLEQMLATSDRYAEDAVRASFLGRYARSVVVDELDALYRTVV
jgi:glycosyltransferase involved in cell wall biosynthesis